jgi:hypothetical protein
MSDGLGLNEIQQVQVVQIALRHQSSLAGTVMALHIPLDRMAF